MTPLPDTIESMYPPIVFNSVIDNRRYAIFGNRPKGMGNGWFEVPQSFTIEDARKRWVKYSPGQIKNAQNQIWKIANSKGNGFYDVKLNDGHYSCSCVGFGYHRDCKHIKQVKNDTRASKNVSR